jgi:hypothetical protein
MGNNKLWIWYLKVLLSCQLFGLKFALNVCQPEFPEDGSNLHPVLHVELQILQRLKVFLKKILKHFNLKVIIENILFGYLFLLIYIFVN